MKFPLTRFEMPTSTARLRKGSTLLARAQVPLPHYVRRESNYVDNVPSLDFASHGASCVHGMVNVFREYRNFATGLIGKLNKGHHVLRDPSLTCPAAIRAVQSTCEVNSNPTMDVSLLYTGIKKLSLCLVARNILVRKPPLDASARPVNFTFHPFQGAYCTESGIYRFK